MPPRTILYTGKGGVGKTSVAVATARRLAASGRRTLVMSTDPAHSLADALETPVGAEPTAVGDGLCAQQVEAQGELRRHWGAIGDWVSRALVERGADRVSAEELVVPPGLDELFSLLRILEHRRSGAWDALVIDCAPTGETLRLLSFPDVARWWLEKVLPREDQLLGLARPIARSLVDGPLPVDLGLGELHGLARSLVSMHEVLRDQETVSVRLVTTPDRLVVDEARRTFTYLSLYGFAVDAVVVNRLFPDDVGAYFQGWRDRQVAELASLREGFAPVPVLTAPFYPRETVGAAALDHLGDAVFAGVDAGALLHEGLARELVVGEERAVLRIAVPFAERGDVQVKRIAGEVVVRVDGHQRTVLLPRAVADYRAGGASLRDGVLEVQLLAPSA